jgi:hypothetical protein
MVVAVSAEVCKPAAHGSLHLELFPGGLSTTSFVIPPGYTAVGQLLCHCIDSVHRRYLFTVSKWLVSDGALQAEISVDIDLKMGWSLNLIAFAFWSKVFFVKVLGLFVFPLLLGT